MCIEDKPRHLVCLIGDNRFVQKGGERQIRKGHLGGNPLDRTPRGNPSQFIARACGRRFSEQVLEVAEAVSNAVDGVVRRHKFPRGW